MENSFAVFIFPHAGGTSYFYRKFLDKETFINMEAYIYEMPGHGLRSEELFAKSFQNLLDDAYEFIAPYNNKKLIFIGHSMGALLSYMLAIKLKVLGKNISLFLASASEPPNIFVQKKSHAPHWKTEALWLTHIQQKESTLNNIDKATRDYFTSSMCADFRVMKSFVLLENIILDCPIWAIYGQDDDVISTQCLQDWHKYTSQSFYHYAFPGNHFYISDHFSSIINLIKAFAREDEVI